MFGCAYVNGMQTRYTYKYLLQNAFSATAEIYLQRVHTTLYLYITIEHRGVLCDFNGNNTQKKNENYIEIGLNLFIQMGVKR